MVRSAPITRKKSRSKGSKSAWSIQFPLFKPAPLGSERNPYSVLPESRKGSKKSKSRSRSRSRSQVKKKQKLGSELNPYDVLPESRAHSKKSKGSKSPTWSVQFPLFGKVPRGMGKGRRRVKSS